jgi:hypothetical protein
LRCPDPVRWAPPGRTGAFNYAASAILSSALICVPAL